MFLILLCGMNKGLLILWQPNSHPERKFLFWLTSIHTKVLNKKHLSSETNGIITISAKTFCHFDANPEVNVQPLMPPQYPNQVLKSYAVEYDLNSIANA